ncbi:MAG: hypothetical protein R3D84_03995 [Paracoccaceae bacterium]
MADPNLEDFHGRLRRIEAIQRRGGGFEAAGTLGRSFFGKQHKVRARNGIWRPLLLVALSVVFLKGVIHNQIGADHYNLRVAELAQGSSVDRLGAFVMKADPATLWVSAKVRDLMR